MTERAQPGAQRTTARNIEYGELTGMHAEGWIHPKDEPTRSAVRYADLDETTFDEFDAQWEADSLTVTILPGEAFVDGWIATDESHEIDLDADTADQEIAIGWDPDAIYHEDIHDTRDEADRLHVSPAGNISDDDPSVVIWSFDTDADGVTAASDLRNIGAHLDIDDLVLDGTDVKTDIYAPTQTGQVSFESVANLETALVRPGERLLIEQATFLTVNGNPIDSGVDLVVSELDGEDGNLLDTILSGDGETVFAREVGDGQDVLYEHANETEDDQLIMIGIDNGLYGTGHEDGESVDVLAGLNGRVTE